MTIEQLEGEAMSLPRCERARLAQRLIASLDGDEQLEQAWYEEAARRLVALESGKAGELPANEVFVALGLEPLP